MDFRIEASNASKCVDGFSSLKSTTLKIPDVLWAKKRVLVMECKTSDLHKRKENKKLRDCADLNNSSDIHGGRFDDLEYLAQHNIDRNRASQELTRIFSQMLYLNGYFHADPV